MKAPVFFDEDGWYYTDYEDQDHGPFPDEQAAHAAFGRYVAQHGNCPTCKGE